MQQVHHTLANTQQTISEQSQRASTSQEGSRAFLAKGQAFTEKEFKQILEMLNKDVQDPKLTNMVGIATCLMSNIPVHDWIMDSGASHHITANKHLLLRGHVLKKSSAFAYRRQSRD